MGTVIMNKILILHGWTYSLAKWDALILLLRQNGFDTKILEIPGLTLKNDEIWDLEKYSEWLDKKIGGSKVILIGHSNGGRIASYYTSLHPEKVSRLVLIDTAGIYHKDIFIQTKRFVFEFAAKLGKKITHSETMKRLLYKLARESDYNKATPNMRKSMLNLIKQDLAESFKKIIVKTIIIWGIDDKVTPIGDARLIHGFIKDSKLEIVKGARHSPFFTHPMEVFEIIKNGI
jgi:pimeloyl-ACP methyl ester carboxylesterase